MNPHSPLMYRDVTPAERAALDHAVTLIPTYLDNDEAYDFNELDPNSDREDG